MPYATRPIRGTKFVKVVNTDTGAVKAKRTTLKRAKSQVRLLEGLEHGTITPRSMGRQGRKRR